LPKFLLDRFHIGRFRSSFLPALLVIALGVTGVVSLHGYRASQEHREVVESVLGAYVSFVAKNAQDATEMAIFSCAEIWLHPVGRPGQDAIGFIRTTGECGEVDGGRFDLDLTKRSVNAATLADQPIMSWLLDTIPGNPEHPRVPGWEIGTLIRPVGGAHELISYAVQKKDGKDVRAIGVVATGALSHALAAVRDIIEVPNDPTGEARITEFFYIGNNTQPAGAEAADAMFTQRRSVDKEFGGLTLNVGLLPKGLSKFAPDGMPRQRGLEFLALFALAAGLVASSLLLLRREEQLARTRANFVSGVSHELRTPLAQIRMFAEMLLLGRVRSEGDRRRSLEIIDTEARRLSQLVENVLQVARSENGHLHVNPTNMRIAPIIRECVESFSMLAQARSIEFRTELQEDLIAPVDSAALRQVVLNLLDNAAKYGPVGQRVVAGVALFDNTARIWVDDEGAGVPVRERQRVFDPFYRIRDAMETTGSGIGLAVVRELVALHGGEVWIEDAPDAGARVVVQFPGAYLSSSQVTGDIAVA
jgi:signal transduction histidine kinase